MENCQINNDQYGCCLHKETEENGEKELDEYDIK